MTSTLEQNQTNKVFLSIVQGKVCQTVPEGTDGARRREWEAGGRSGVKWEKVYDAVNGKIENVYFYDGESDGRKYSSLNVEFEENEHGKKPVLSTTVDSRYAQDLMKKLPNVDFSEDVRIRPFSFQPEGEDKNVTGVEIMQRGVSGNFEKKITSAFHKKEGNKTVVLHDFPTPQEAVMDTDDWKVYFTQVKKFLVKYTRENVSTKFENKEYKSEQRNVDQSYDDYPTEEISPDDIPF